MLDLELLAPPSRSARDAQRALLRLAAIYEEVFVAL